MELVAANKTNDTTPTLPVRDLEIALEEIKPCNLDKPCQENYFNKEIHTVDCKYSEWTDWGECSTSCGAGEKTRTRKIVDNPVGKNPKLCEDGALVEVKSCNLQHCPEWYAGAQDCRISQWTSWTMCSSTCNGVRSRYRDITQYPARGGKGCHEIGVFDEKHGKHVEELVRRKNLTEEHYHLISESPEFQKEIEHDAGVPMEEVQACNVDSCALRDSYKAMLRENSTDCVVVRIAKVVSYW